MKCVVVTRDPKGFGLTVSGDNPVYVQSVKEGIYGFSIDTVSYVISD